MNENKMIIVSQIILKAAKFNELRYVLRILNLTSNYKSIIHVGVEESKRIENKKIKTFGKITFFSVI